MHSVALGVQSPSCLLSCFEMFTLLAVHCLINGMVKLVSLLKFSTKVCCCSWPRGRHWAETLTQ